MKSATIASFPGLAGTRENFGASAPRHQLLHPVSGRSLCRHGPLRALHYIVDVRQPSYCSELYFQLDKSLDYIDGIMQVRAGHAAKDIGASLPHDPVQLAQLCRALQLHDVRGWPLKRPGEILLSR